MDDHREIIESDLTQSRLKKVADETETLIDLEKGIFVTFGIPLDEQGVVVVPDKPHVFIAGELDIKDKSHTQEVILKEIPVLMAHGVRDEKDQWNFLNGQGVVETVETYNQYALREQLPKVEFVLTCNDDPITQGSGVQFHEFEDQSLIAHVAGEDVHVLGGMEENGRTKLYIRTKDNILNLDNLITSKEVR